MSRESRPSGPTISLFPFLAVLLCMMGALLVLLVIFSRSASLQEVSSDSSLSDELELEHETLSWRIEQLKSVREQTASDLEKARMQLAGIEDHARKLSDEFQECQRLRELLVSSGTLDEVQEEEIDRLKAEAREALESLEKEKKNGKKKPAAYAVVPFVGPNGTHRRPLYIECCIDGVFLQPEGIRLSPSDFEGPPGPGNPLASALRAAREHLAATATPETASSGIQPYPLLLIRPSGVMAYYAARESIASWGSEFGYQFVNEEWTLTYPNRDPALADVETRAIEEARRRLEWLAEMRPSQPSRPGRGHQYRAATTRGGVVNNSGPSVLGDQSQWTWSNQVKGRQSGGSHGNDETSDGSQGGDGSGHRGGSIDQTGGGDPVLGGKLSGTVDAGGSVSDSNTQRAQSSSRSLGRSTGGSEVDSTGSPSDRSSLEASLVGDRYASRSGKSGGSEQGSPSGNGTKLATNSQQAGGSGGTSAGDSGGSSSASSEGGSNGAGGGVSMPGMLAVGQSGEASASASAATGGSTGGGGSLASSRGANWASLETSDRPIPLTRPILIECAAEELRMIDDSGKRVEKRISFNGSTEQSVDLLVASVHEKVKTWGIAGDRLYWRPKLVLSDVPGGLQRCKDLEILLSNSGIEILRHKEEPIVKRLPPISSFK